MAEHPEHRRHEDVLKSAVGRLEKLKKRLAEPDGAASIVDMKTRECVHELADVMLDLLNG